MNPVTSFITIIILLASFAAHSDHWIDISTGGNHSIALTQSGFVFTTGRNDAGQLGNGTTTDQNVFKKVASLSSIIDVAAFGNRSYVLKSDGTVWKTTNSGGWVQTLSGISAIEEKTVMVIAKKSTGGVWDADSGATLSSTLKDLSRAPYSFVQKNADNTASFDTGMFSGLFSSPVKKVDGKGSCTDWYGRIGCSGNGPFILAEDGGLYVVGSISTGSAGLGTANYDPIITPILTKSNVIDFVATYYSTDNAVTFVITDDHKLWFSGKFYYGLAGIGVGSGAYRSWVETASDVQKVSASRYNALILKTDGTMWGAGSNYYGELGLATSVATQGETTQSVAALAWTQVASAGEMDSISVSKGTYSDKIELSWTNSIAPIPAAQFEVYRSVGLNGNKTLIATVIGSSYIDTSVSEGVVYGYYGLFAF